MTELVSGVTFKPCPLGRETVHLGDNQVGQIIPWPCTAGSRMAVFIDLPDIPNRKIIARTLDQARVLIAREVEDWCRRSQGRADSSKEAGMSEGTGREHNDFPQQQHERRRA